MVDILMRKITGGFVPVDDAGEEFVGKFKHGSIVKVSIIRPRNIGFHRKFFALIAIVCAHQDIIQADSYGELQELVLNSIKVLAGHYTKIVGPNGGVLRIPKSISFVKMDQTEFEIFYNRALNVCLKYFLPRWTSEEMRKNIEAQMEGFY